MTSHEDRSWYYATANHERVGPVGLVELSELAGKGVIGEKTLVWNPRFANWVPASEISDLLISARKEVVAAASGEIEVDEVALVSVPEEIRPRKGLFLGPRIATGILASGLSSALLSGMLRVSEIGMWPGLVLFVCGSVFAVLSAFAAYRKEHCVIEDGRVICRRGGLMSDQTTEFEIRNITLIKIRLPWIRHKFYGVGNIVIQTAGTSQPVVMRVIQDPESVYESLRKRMRRNGFDLTQRQLLYEDRPALIGVIGECLGLLIGGFGLGFVVIGFVAGTFEGFLKGDSAGVVWLYGIFAIGVIGLIFFIIVRFLDLQRRIYRVFNDVVVYEEGFLTRENAFIPYENLSDSNTNCSFWDRIFGIYDVNVSCQGSGSEIKFRRLANGIPLSAAIDQIVVHAGEKKKAVARVVAAKAASDRAVISRRAEPEAIPIGEVRLAELRMNAARTFLPLMLLVPLIPIWIVAMIQYGVRLASTRYSVRHGSLRHSYRFLTLHDREFACEKITGMVIKRNLWDRMFGTMTLRFWSIGSGKPLEFTHVHGSEFDLPSLMRQVGIPGASPEPHEVKAEFGFAAWLRASLIYLPIWIPYLAATVFAAMEFENDLIYYLLGLPLIVGLFAWGRGMLYYPRQRLLFHDHHVEARQGILVQRQYFARYGNIKRSESTCYPGGKKGKLEIFVAGEEEVLQGVQQQRHGVKGMQPALKQCSFTSGYLPEVVEKALLLDGVLSGRAEPGQQVEPATGKEILLEARRSVGNAIVQLILVSVLLFPLIVLLPVTVPIVWIRVGRWRYRVEDFRVVVSRGVFYRKQTSILLDRVDSLQQKQGVLNKVFRNGDVSIMTAGSSKPDLKVIDSPGYLALYQLIRERSQ